MHTRRDVNTEERTTRFRPDIQGLRAVAVTAVVLYHARVPFLSGGYVGVDVFFVISGFLITSHLLEGLRREGTIKLGSFYAQRARRILPASLVVVILSIAAALIWYPPLLLREVWQAALATVFYMPNLLFAAEGTNYLAEQTPSLFQHYWSLGIEEQFYLVWPVLLWVGFVLVKRNSKVLFVAVALLVGLSFAACVFLTFRAQPWAFFLLPTRAWELGVGGLAAFLVIHRPNIAGRAAALLGWVGLVGVLASFVLFNETTQFPGYWAAIPVLATAAIIVGGTRRSSIGPQGLLSLKPLMFVGAISYSLYLVHWPLLLIPQAAAGFEEPLPIWGALVLGGLSVPLAWLLHRYVEQPGRNGAWLTQARPRRSLLAAGSASIAVALFATGAYAYSGSRPLSSGEAAPATVISAPPTATDFVPTNLMPTLRAASGDQPAVYDDGCHLGFAETMVEGCVYGAVTSPRIVLFGDSHAAQWFPALLQFAENAGYSIVSHTKSSCPSVSADVLRNQVPYEECTAWRDTVIEKINAEKPALVLIANYGTATLADPGGDYAAAWEDALRLTIDRIHAPSVVVADSPNLGSTPSVCLSANLSTAINCGRSRDAALASPAREAEARAVAGTGASYVDLTAYMCTDQWCPAILGDTLVYRDAHHITATFSSLLGTVLGAELEKILAE